MVHGSNAPCGAPFVSAHKLKLVVRSHREEEQESDLDGGIRRVIPEEQRGRAAGR